MHVEKNIAMNELLDILKEQINKRLTLKYSETFYSAQGEGQYVGIPSLWMRFFLCNLQCNGFGQKDPTDPSTYELPYETIDIKHIDNVFDLPVFEKGCDSSYTWSKRYKHLNTDKTVEEAVDELTALLPHGQLYTSCYTTSNTHGVYRRRAYVKEHTARHDACYRRV